MIFEVDPKTKTLNVYKSFWNPRELELERYLISTAEEEVPTLNSSVFGETLLLVSNQVRTRASKKADILALDHMGNSVIIELKRKNSLSYSKTNMKSRTPRQVDLLNSATGVA